MTSNLPTRPTSLAEWDERFKQALASRFEESEKLAKEFQPLPNDLFVTPYAKSGTTWLQQIVHGLRTRGDMDFDDISRVIPWLDCAYAQGIDPLAPQRGSFRAFKSHKNWHDIQKGGRYLVSIRDPKDALVSSFRFGEGWTFAVGSVAISEYAKGFLKEPEKQGYWHHLLSWWSQRDNPNVLLLCYEEMRRDLPATVEKIASFLSIELDDELRQIVLRQSSLEFMLKHKDKFDDFLMHKLFVDAGTLPPGGDSAKVRTGAVGQHRYELPAEIGTRMDEIWQEVVTPELGFVSYQELRNSLAERM